jgi:nitrite reductase/ring-hydroxylating ferredoxin subunit
VTWTDVGPDLEDGELTEVHAAGLTIGVARVGDDRHAFEGWCTHADCPLAEGDLEGAAVRCVCHGALFRLADGVPIEGPAEEPVRTFPVRVREGRMEIDL